MDKIDCIAFGPHPDDVELFCGGTLIKLKSLGYTTGVVDLTGGELSTNGDVVTRQKEADKAAAILDLDERQNLMIPDGSIENKRENRNKIIRVIRSLKPDVCLVPYWEDRHPDHIDASKLIQTAIFESGLAKIDASGIPYRPRVILFYMLHYEFNPSFVVDISDENERKNKAIQAYSSQFSKAGDGTKPTYINQSNFLNYINDRAAVLGYRIGTKYGEGFYYKGMIKIDNIMNIFS